MKTQAKMAGTQPRVKGCLGPPEAGSGGGDPPLGPVPMVASDFWPRLQTRRDGTVASAAGSGQDGTMASAAGTDSGPALLWPQGP